jgi:PAS domain S-box-containing protein
MVSSVDLFFGVGILASLGLCWLGLYTYRRWNEPGITAFVTVLVLLGLSGVVGGVVSLTLGPIRGDTVLWGTIGVVSALVWFLPWGVFGLQYTGRYVRLSPRRLALLLVPYIVIFVLFVSNFVFGVRGGVLGSILIFLVGLYLLGLFTISIGLVVKTSLEYAHLSLWSGLALCAVPVTHVVLLNISNSFSTPVVVAELYALTFALPAISAGVALLYYETFEATPAVGTIGEREIAHTLDELLFVIDEEAHIIKLNEAATDALGTTQDELLGRDFPDVLGHTTDELRERESVTLDTTDGRRRYDSQVSDVTDQHGRKLGVIVSLHDVTTHELREQRLTVLNRVLRHNLRNKIEVVKGNAEILREENGSEYAETIVETADSIADLGQSARAIDRFVARSATSVEVDLTDAVEKALDAVRRDNNDVSVSLECPETAGVETTAPALKGALESAIENALAHAETTVEISVTAQADGYRIVVADDGPGIPENELECLDAGTETPLQHGTGLGLWQLKWAVRTMGGDLEFDTSDGTTVSFTVPDQRAVESFVTQ